MKSKLRARTWQKRTLKFKFNVVKSDVDYNKRTPLDRLGKPERALMMIAVDGDFLLA